MQKGKCRPEVAEHGGIFSMYHHKAHFLNWNFCLIIVLICVSFLWEVGYLAIICTKKYFVSYLTKFPLFSHIQVFSLMSNTVVLPYSKTKKKNKNKKNYYFPAITDITGQCSRRGMKLKNNYQYPGIVFHWWKVINGCACPRTLQLESCIYYIGLCLLTLPA